MTSTLLSNMLIIPGKTGGFSCKVRRIAKKDRIQVRKKGFSG